MILLVRAKQVGLSFSELNEFSIGELLTFIKLFYNVQDKKIKKATQSDIDKLLA